MKFRYAVFFMLIALAFASCQKNTVSSIPSISLQYFGPLNGSDTLISKTDTCLLRFTLADGDADLGNPLPGPPYDIYIDDMRYDSAGFVGYFFPAIDQGIEDPKNGIQGTCEFFYYPSVLGLAPTLTPRNGVDTVYLKIYIQDRAGHHSDTITTRRIVLLP